MPVLVLPAFWAAVAGGTAAAGIAVQARAASHAADVSAEATNTATAAQTESTDKTLAFQKEQAALDAQRAETNRQANYEQWAAREGRLSSVGGMLGLPARNIPGYVPLSSSQTVSGMAPAPASGQQPQVAPQDFGNLQNPDTWMGLVKNPQQLSTWVRQGLGPKASDDLVNYYVGKIQGQPGANPTEQAGSAAYWMQKLQNDPNVTGVPGTPEATAKKAAYTGTPSTGSVAALAPSTAAYTAPQLTFGQNAAPGSILNLSRYPQYGA